MQIQKAFAQMALTDTKVLTNILREAERQSVEALRPIKRPEGARFVYKFVNGAHVIFDRWTYRNCEVLATEKIARGMLA
jgi:hypothetical protein